MCSGCAANSRNINGAPHRLLTGAETAASLAAVRRPRRGGDGRDQAGGVSRPLDQAPAVVEAYWAEALPRAHAVSAAAEQLAPQLVGLTTAEAQEAAGRLPGVSLRFLPPNAIVAAEGVFGRVNAVVVDDRVVSLHTG